MEIKSCGKQEKEDSAYAASQRLGDAIGPVECDYWTNSQDPGLMAMKVVSVDSISATGAVATVAVFVKGHEQEGCSPNCLKYALQYSLQELYPDLKVEFTEHDP